MMGNASTSQEKLSQLRQQLVQHFNKNELRTICFDLGINHDNLPDALDSMARELVALCVRDGRLSDLVERCRSVRPHVEWPDIPQSPVRQQKIRDVPLPWLIMGTVAVIAVAVFASWYLIAALSAKTPPSTNTPSVASAAGTATPTVTAIATSSPPPTETASPVLTAPPTLTPVATAPLTINLKEIRETLWNQASFHVAITYTLVVSNIVNYDEGTWTKEPESRDNRSFENGVMKSHLVKIRTRLWYTQVDAPNVWLSNEHLPQDLADGISKLSDVHWKVITASLQEGLPDREAWLVQQGVSVDGSLCNEYGWGGLTSGHVFIAANSGLPVKINLDLAEPGLLIAKLEVNRINAPSNVIQAPTSSFPEKVHIDDARMALNGLSSFRWTASLRTISQTGMAPSEAYFGGTYVLANQTWLAFQWDNAEMSGTPIYKFLMIGQKPWAARGDAGQPWLRPNANGLQDMDNLANPFRWWTVVADHFGQGSLTTEQARSIGSTRCDEYLFSATWKDGQGRVMKGEMHLFIVPDNRVPMRAELTVTNTGSTSPFYYYTTELSHLNDPSNVVKLPPRPVE